MIGALVGGLIVGALVFAVMFASVHFTVRTSPIRYRSLDYEMTVQPNGDLKVTQHIDMRLDKRDGGDPWRQLFQSYEIDGYDLSDITGISVRNVDTGETYTQEDPISPADVPSDARWDRYHAGHWYIADTDAPWTDTGPRTYTPGRDGLPIYDDPTAYQDYAKTHGLDDPPTKTVEIGWNIPTTVKSHSMRFDVTMTLVGAVTLYQDVASFRWEPISSDNTVPIDAVTGTIRFPEGVHAADPWGWLDHEGASEMPRDADGTLRFAARNVKAGRPLDLVVAYSADVARDTSHGTRGRQYSPAGTWIRHRDGEQLPSLKQGEREQERQWRDRQRRTATTWGVVAAIGAALAGVMMVFALRALFRSLRPMPGKSDESGGADESGDAAAPDLAYVREPPDISPIGAARIADILGLSGKVMPEGRRLAAAILELACGNAIGLHPGPGRTVTITVPPSHRGSRDGLRLRPYEDKALLLLEGVAERLGRDTFDLDEMRDTCRTWRDGVELLDDFERACRSEYRRLGATERSGRIVGTLAAVTGLYGVVAAIVAWRVTGDPVMAAMFVVSSVALAVAAVTICSGDTFTRKGMRYARRVYGLYHHLEDAGGSADRDVADPAFRNRLLVYATAMGVSGKAMRGFADAFGGDDGTGDIGARLRNGFAGIAVAIWSAASASSSSGGVSDSGSGGGSSDTGSGIGDVGGGGADGGGFDGTGGGSGGGSFGGR